MNLLLTLLVIWCGPSTASTYSAEARRERAPEFRTVEELTSTLSALATSGTPEEKRSALHSLGMVYALAYATGDKQVPVKAYLGKAQPDTLTWIRLYTGQATAVTLPSKIKQPITEERKSYLQKAKDTFERSSLELGTPSPNLAWALLQMGEKTKARAIYERVLSEQSRERGMADLYTPKGYFYSPLDEGARTIRIVRNGKLATESPIFLTLFKQSTMDVAKGKYGDPRKPDWSVERDAYLKNPTEGAFQAFVARVRKDFPNPNGELNIVIHPLIKTMTREALLSELSFFHRAHSQSSALLSENLATASTAETAAICKSVVGSAIFADGAFSLKTICAANLAWKKKNWGICKEVFSSSASLQGGFNECVNYLAFRSGKVELCHEVEVQLKKENLMNFNQALCGEAAKGSPVNKKLPSAGQIKGEKFYAKTDWKLNRAKLNLGGIAVSVRSNRTGGVELEDITHWEKFEPGEGGAPAEASQNLLKPGTFKTEKLEVNVVTVGGKALFTTPMNLPMMPTDDSFGKMPDSFTLEDALGKGDSDEKYYVMTLDPTTDASIISSIRKEAWLDIQRSNNVVELRAIY